MLQWLWRTNGISDNLCTDIACILQASFSDISNKLCPISTVTCMDSQPLQHSTSPFDWSLSWVQKSNLPRR